MLVLLLRGNGVKNIKAFLDRASYEKFLKISPHLFILKITIVLFTNIMNTALQFQT